MFTINQNLIDDFADKINEKEKKNNKVTSWSSTTTDAHYPSEKLVKDSLDNHTHNSQISYGKVDSTSTSTVFTATVQNLTSLTDGTTVMLRNGVVASASGFTLNVNDLGAKPVYNSMADATRDTTIFNINYTMLFVYDSTRVSDGCWICYRGYNSDTNTIAYQIRTNSQKMYATDKTYRYRLLLEVDDTNYMPVNLSTSTSADVSKTSTMNTREFKLGGNIIYYSNSSAINQNAQYGNPYLWKQYTFSLGFSFNNTNTALELAQWSPVYMVAEKSATNEGMAKLVSPYYTQSLPNSEDGKLYIFLGQAYNTTNIEMVLEHPIYEYKNGKIRLYRDYYTATETDTLLNGKLDVEDAFTGSYADLSNKPSIPSASSDLSDGSDLVKKSSTVGLLKNDGSVMSSGTGSSNWAVGNHTHSQYLTSHQDISGKEDKSNKVTSLSENSTNTQYPSAKTVYDELMNVRTVTPSIYGGDRSQTVNNVTKNLYYSPIDSSDLEYFEKIVYNITFEDNDFQMFFQPNPKSSNIQIIYFDGTDCYWGEVDDNNGDLTKGSLICEGNTIQATLNKDKTVTIGNTIVNWDINEGIIMFGNVNLTYTIYSHKYLDTDFPYTFGDSNFSIASGGDYTVNSVTKDSGEIYLSSSTNWDNAIEKIYTITFNDDNFSYLDMNHGDNTIYFDGTDCYWGEWDENNNSVLNKGTLICEGNVVQATYLANNDGRTYFPDGNYLTDMDTANLNYFGDVNIKMRTKALVLEYANNKIHYLTDSFNDYICYPSIATLKDYAEDKSNKVTSWSNTTTDIHYPSEKLVKDSLDGKANSTHNHTKSQITDFPTIPSKTSDLTNDSGFLTSHQDISGKEDKSNKVTSLSENSTNTQYPSAKTVYDELMNVRTVTPSIDNDGSKTLNNVTKNWCTSSIDSSDLEYFEKIVYNITFEDNDFQMFQYFTDYIIYFDGTDCYWGEWDENDNSVLNKGTLICEGNTIQATLNKYKTVTIGDTITDGDIRDEIRMFGNIDFTYTIYSHKYLDTDYPYTFEYHNFEKASMGDATTNSVTKEYGYIFLSKWDNPIEAIYTITFNDDDDSYLDFGYEATIYFDGTYCYWGVWDEHYNNVIGLHRICEGNVVQATYLCNDDKIHFPDGNSISTMDNWNYFGDVKIKVRNKILVLEYASNKTYNIENSFNDAICYPSIATLKNYAETKINKVYNISSSSTHTQYPTAKCVYDNLNSVYDNFIFNENLTPYTHILSNYTNTSSATLSIANEVLTITGNGASNSETGLLNTKVFAPITEDYIISFDIQKPTGTYAGKDFQIVVGDNNHYLSISPQYYVIRFGENGTEFSTVEAIQCTTYTNLAIQRTDGNNWKFYMNNSLIHSFSTSSSEIPNQITFYGLHNNDVVNVKNVKITRKRIDSSNELVDMIYPVGSIYMSVNNVSPQYLFGGTWEQIKDTFLLAAGDTYANGSTGGSATVTLTSAQSGVPAHSHKYNDYNTTYTLKTTNRKPGTSTAVAYGTSLTAGGGATERTSSNNTAANASQSHENMPPYLAVYMWKRIA